MCRKGIDVLQLNTLHRAKGVPVENHSIIFLRYCLLLYVGSVKVKVPKNQQIR